MHIVLNQVITICSVSVLDRVRFENIISIQLISYAFCPKQMYYTKTLNNGRQSHNRIESTYTDYL